MTPRTYRTAEVARAVGVHPNTVRLYEEWGLLPPIPRTPNGYRVFGGWHIQQMRLARLGMQVSWLGGAIRRLAYAIVRARAAGDAPGALADAHTLRGLLTEEQRQARAAAEVLDRWVRGGGSTVPTTILSIGQAARELGVSRDVLRGWERNGLLDVPRNPGNGYRRYGPAEISRLRVIRTLRKARYSTMSVLRMLHAYERGQRTDLPTVLDQPGPEEDAVYATDRWLTTLDAMTTAAAEMIALLHEMDAPTR